MIKIILIIFLTFLISSTSNSNPENIKIAPSIKDNVRMVNKCQRSEDQKVFVFGRNYNNRYNPIVFEKFGEDELTGYRLIGNLFLDNQRKEFIFYDNIGGVIIKKYVFSGSSKKPDLNSKSFIVPNKKGETLYKEYKQIQELSDKNKISLDEYSKKFREYSISLKNYSEETIKKFDKREISLSDEDYTCGETDVLSIKNF